VKYEKEEKKRLAKTASGSSFGRVLSGLSTPRSDSSRVVEEWDDGAGGYNEYEHDGVSRGSGRVMGSRRSTGRMLPRTSHRGRRERPRYYDDDVDY
jgi:hypothetical protein